MGLVVVEQALLECAQLEEVVVLLHLDHRPAVHRALAVDQLVLGVVVLAGHAVEARVEAQLDEAVVVDPLQELLHHLVVPRLGRPDEVVVRDVERPPRLDEALRRAVRPLLGRRVVGLGRLDDLGPVLVRAGHEPHVVPEQPVPARQRVGVDRRVRRADVRRVVDVVDRRGQVVGRHRRKRTGAPRPLLTSALRRRLPRAPAVPPRTRCRFGTPRLAATRSATCRGPASGSSPIALRTAASTSRSSGRRRRRRTTDHENDLAPDRVRPERVRRVAEVCPARPPRAPWSARGRRPPAAPDPTPPARPACRPRAQAPRGRRRCARPPSARPGGGAARSPCGAGSLRRRSGRSAARSPRAPRAPTTRPGRP